VLFTNAHPIHKRREDFSAALEIALHARYAGRLFRI